MDSTNKFTPMQLDALKEVSNIGAGNAATALSMMLGKKIDMTVPSVNMILLDELFNNVGEEVVAGVVVRIIGDIQGSILIIFKSDVAKDVVEMLLGKREEDFSELGVSVLCEIGNILTGAYMNSISQFTGLKVTSSVPAVSYDMISAILATTFVEAGQFEDYILDIETVFLDEGSKNFGTHFYYVPEPNSLEKILKSIGVF